MIDKDKLHPTHQPRRPVRGMQHYKELHQQVTKKHPKESSKDLFSMNIMASTTREEYMDGQIPQEQSFDENQFHIKMVFKPLEPGMRLRPEEIQVLLAYMAEVLKEIEEEEKRIIEEEKAGLKQE